MSEPARREDVDRIGAAIQALAEHSREAIDAQTAVLREFVDAAKQPHGQIQHVTVPQTSASPRSERLAWAMFAMVSVMSTVTGGAVVASFLQGQRISDLRADMQTERLSREAMDNWTAQEVTAIRSYITNGKLQPMQPRPERKTE